MKIAPVVGYVAAPIFGPTNLIQFAIFNFRSASLLNALQRLVPVQPTQWRPMSFGFNPKACLAGGCKRYVKHVPSYFASTSSVPCTDTPIVLRGGSACQPPTSFSLAAFPANLPCQLWHPSNKRASKRAEFRVSTQSVHCLCDKRKT